MVRGRASSEIYIYRQRDKDVASLHWDVVLRTPFELLRIYSFIGVVGLKNNGNEENKRNTMSMV